MERDCEAIVRRARALIGCRFRAQGRDPRAGLDCIGVAALSLGIPASGVAIDYTLRSAERERLAAALQQHGLDPVDPPEPQPGDLAVFAAGPGQLHLGVLTGSTIIHADASLRRTVERPLPAPWPMIGLWRRPGSR